MCLIYIHPSTPKGQSQREKLPSWYPDSTVRWVVVCHSAIVEVQVGSRRGVRDQHSVNSDPMICVHSRDLIYNCGNLRQRKKWMSWKKVANSIPSQSVKDPREFSFIWLRGISCRTATTPPGSVFTKAIRIRWLQLEVRYDCQQCRWCSVDFEWVGGWIFRYGAIRGLEIILEH